MTLPLQLSYSSRSRSTMPASRQIRLWTCLFVFTIANAFAGSLQAQSRHLPVVPPTEIGLRTEQLQLIDDVVQEGLEAGRMPGCVIAIGRKGKLGYLKAYGNRQTHPTPQAMTVDTVFDMASITKPVATATSIMILLEQGKVRLRNKVADYIPEFAVNGKQDITVQQLLIHQGGLIPDNALADYEDGAEKAMERVMAVDTYVEPGTKFVYTDVGFIVLAEIVQRVSGMNVHEFSQRHIFQPLGMSETGYLPAEALRQRAAVTEQREDRWMQGEVHDPRAYRLGGIAGHAGLFSTAQDLAIYAAMMVNRGSWQGTRVMSPLTMHTMTAEYPVSSGIRGLGWDKQTGYSSNRSELFTSAAFGHGGFTGTVLWMDPELDLFFIFLSNRVHPDGKGNVNSLAGRIATIATAAIDDDSANRDAQATRGANNNEVSAVKTGLDILVRNHFDALQGQRIGLITNHTGIDSQGVSVIQRMHQSADVQLTALFSPEHGIAGKLDVAKIGDSQDASTGVQVFSLYGETRQPTAEQLANVETLVFDIQDIGCRFYTYISTMGLAMEAAAKHGKRFVVLDRPNAIGGLTVAGPVLDAGSESFVGYHPICVQHGMTVGELATMFAAEKNLDLDLHVIRMEGWQRNQTFDQTILPWVNPSPNMRNINQALLYPGIGLLETTNVSVGRGTDAPFELFGAPWLDAVQLVTELQQYQLPGIEFTARSFTPDSSKHQGEVCHGFHAAITDRRALQSVRTGLAIAVALKKLYPQDWDTSNLNRLLCDQAVCDAILSGDDLARIEAMFQDERQTFLQRRSGYLLY